MTNEGVEGDLATDRPWLAAGLPPPLPPLPPPLPFLVAPARVRTSMRSRRRSYVAAHWHGELPLAQSYWVNDVLVSFVFSIFEQVLSAGLKSAHPSLFMVLVVLVLFEVVRLLVAVWQVVGTLRSAALSGSRWAVLVNCLMMLGIMATLAVTVRSIDIIQGLARGAAEQQRLSNYQIGVAPAGDAIIAQGPVGLGYAQAVIHTFAEHPQIHQLRLDSIGGDVDNGMQLHDFLAGRPDITVEADGLCASACTLVFLGGEQRIVGPKTRLGFHQFRSILDTRESIESVETKQETYKQLMSKRGASPDFIRLAFAKQGNQAYFPDIDELFANDIITGIRLGNRLLTAADWRSEQFLYGYRERPEMRQLGVVLASLQQRQPALFDEWVRRNLDAKRLPDPKARSRGYTYSLWITLHAARRQAMYTASAVDVRRFVDNRLQIMMLLRDRISADACGAFLQGQALTWGDQTHAYFELTGEGYAALLSGADPVQIDPADWQRGEHELALAQAATATHSHAVDDNAAVCQRQIVLLNRLTTLPSDRSDMALRSYFLHMH